MPDEEIHRRGTRRGKSQNGATMADGGDTSVSSAQDAGGSSNAAESGSKSMVRGASILVVLQIASRAVTFIANQFLLRYLTARLLGISAQLEVYYLSVLFFARESLRVAIQRKKGSSRVRDAQDVVNLAYLSIFLGVLVATLLGWIYLASVGTDIATTPFFTPSVYMYGAAALVELLSEPIFVVMQVRLQFGVRAAAEPVATFVRCSMTLGSAVWAARNGLDVGVLPFAMGQLGYGCGLLLVYAYSGLMLASREGFSLYPVRQAGADYVLSYFYRPTLTLASSMIAQSLVKHILTQGDTFLVSILSTPSAQGIYALANNYGGLLARLVLQPIEESSRSYFSQALTSVGDNRPGSPSGPVATACQDIQTIFKLYILFSTAVVTLGPVAAPSLLSVVAGPAWATSGADKALAAYMWYIPLLALNGVAEAFVASVATEAEVHRQSAWMGVFSVVFACAGFVCLRLLDMGAVGLVVANSINMACRICWSTVFIGAYFRRAGVGFETSALRPKLAVLLAAFITRHAIKTVASVDTAASTTLKDHLLNLATIALLAIPFAIVLLASERAFLQQCYNSVRGKRKVA